LFLLINSDIKISKDITLFLLNNDSETKRLEDKPLFFQKDNGMIQL